VGVEYFGQYELVQVVVVDVTGNVIVDWVEVIQDAGDTDVNSVLDLRVCSENAAYMNDVCDDGDYPMGLSGLNEATRCRVMDKNVDGGGRGCPMDFVSLNGARIGLVVHELLVQGMHWAHN
jgi:hypothetical protein